ncbi:hypothetical protein BU15DRAFT_69289 [Melanogaster broomeanus]|nr:hypothetical protein BU15DRAFT_69289 [Melanogaster broomeanus]
MWTRRCLSGGWFLMSSVIVIMAHTKIRIITAPIHSSPSGQIPPRTAPPNHPASNKVAIIAPSSIGSPTTLSVPASPQPPDLLSPAVGPITSCIASSSNAAVTSPPPPALENVLPTSVQSPPQAVDPPLLDVLSPEEIAMCHNPFAFDVNGANFLRLREPSLGSWRVLGVNWTAYISFIFVTLCLKDGYSDVAKSSRYL